MAITTANLSSSDTVQSIFITGLRNAHALEKEATQLINRQLERLEHYPEMEKILRQHGKETEGQIQRLDEILSSLGEDSSALKDLGAQFMGNMAAIAHTPMADEILKNTFANHAFEAFEIAAYKSLITVAEAAGHSRYVSALEQTLKEEEKTAGLIYDQIEAITSKFLTRSANDVKADR